MKRWLLFFGVNIMVMITISIVLSLLGVRGYMTAYGINYESLMIFCLVWGMGGAFISLFISKWMAKTMMGVQIIEPSNPQYGELVRTVHRLSKQAGLEKMPEVGIYESPDVNAFATGPSRNNSLVAVSTGLLRRMDSSSVEGVLGHEVAHIANGDMVTMTLIQGVVNAFVMFLARVVAFFISQALKKDDEEGHGLGYFAQHLVVMVLEILFGILGSMVVAWFSRYREFRADQGGAKVAGREKMIGALEALQKNYETLHKPEGAFASMQISSKKSWLALFSTHPPLEDRIARLKRSF